MNSLVIYLPFCYPFSPYLAMPILTGQLKKYGNNAKCYDMNVDFHYEVYNKKFLEKSLKKAKNILESEEYRNIPDIDISDLDFNLPIEEKIAILKKNIIKNGLKDNEELIDYTISHIEDSISINP